MKLFDFLKSVKAPEHRLAWLVAIAVDAIQIGFLPLFAAEDCRQRTLPSMSWPG
jgi:hypothetical protein